MKQRESILSREDRKTSQGYVDLKKISIEQLEELIERQNKLLQNRSFVARLPDKGAKVISFKAELEAEHKKRQEGYDSACQLLHNLNLDDTAPEDIEWNRGLPNKQTQRDSDDDSEGEMDPLKLVATHSGTAKGVKMKIGPAQDGRNTLYVDKFCEKYGNTDRVKERFKPNQLRDKDVNFFVESAEKVKKRFGNKWEVTEATPPVAIYKNAVMISLPESLKLQREQAEKLKEIEKKHATEKLMQNLVIKMGDKLPVNNITEYRSVKNVFDESVGEDEENECVDPESEDKEQAVYFPVEN